MIQQTIHIPDYDWTIHCFYVVQRLNADRVLRKLESIGCEGKDLERARHSLETGACDTGISYTSAMLGESVMVISRTSNAKEYLMSLSHEVGHIANHIAIFYGLPLNGEDVRYISDEIISKTWPISKELLCDECRSIEKDYSGREGGRL